MKDSLNQIGKVKKRRFGPEPRPAEDLRKIRISVFLTEQESNKIRQTANSFNINPSAYIRIAILSKTPRQIPEINRKAWASLARVVGNLNQYQAAINEGRASGYPLEVLSELREMVQELRRDLLGMKPVGENEEDEGDGQD
jgi:hypothetical protein